MITDVEARIHRALQSQPLERIDGGYRLVHPGGAGISLLRLRPVAAGLDSSAATDSAALADAPAVADVPAAADVPAVAERPRVVAIAEITAEHAGAGLPNFHPLGVQRLNGMAVYGAYDVSAGRLRQTAQYSIYAQEPAAHLVAQGILNAFGAQLPLGRSTALATASEAVMKQQRAHHHLPGRWRVPLPPAAFEATVAALRARGIAASNNATAVWAELPLGGKPASRSLDPRAETALLQVDTAVPHPIAGAGYLTTLRLPWARPPASAAELCLKLNALELAQVDFPPRLGAWGLLGREDLPGYSCFVPAAEPAADLHQALMWWSVWRALWIRDRCWSAEQGLRLG